MSRSPYAARRHAPRRSGEASSIARAGLTSAVPRASTSWRTRRLSVLGVLGLLGALALVGAPTSAVAAAPRLSWRTVVTPHFRIHYHEGLEGLAARLAPIAEDARAALGARLGHLPTEPVHVVLTDETDGPNGFAQVLPYNLITLFAAVPEPAGALGDFDDYWRMLLTHELAHVVHLDTIGGIPALVNRVIGKQLAPNQVQPRWWIEGLATWLESDLTGAGRIRSAVFDMMVRAQVEAGELPTLAEISTLLRAFPGGTGAYLYGGRFLDGLARRYGAEAIAEVSARYGARLIPYGLSLVSGEVLARDVPSLWAEWAAAEHDHALEVRARVEAEPPAPRTVASGLADDLRAPRVAEDGTFVVFEARRDDDAQLVFRRRLGTSSTSTTWAVEAPFLRLRSPSGEGAFTGDGRFVAVVEDVYRQRYRYRDLEVIELRTGRRTRRTSGARLSDPDVHGGRIVAVAQAAGQTTLVTLPVDGDGAPQPLYAPGPERFVFGPRWSPDGRQVAASVMDSDGTRGLIVVDAATGALTQLTRSTALDHAPAWLPDGRALLFTSDRGGVFDLHRVTLEDGAVVRLTRERLGAFDPVVVAGAGLVLYRAGQSRGSELCVAPLEALAPRVPREVRRAQARTASVSFATSDDEPYQAWETLLPQRIRGSLALASAGLGLTLELDGADVVGEHTWGLALGYAADVQRLSYSFGYVNRQLWTPLRLSSFLGTELATRAFVSDGEATAQRGSVWGLRASLDIPLSAWDIGAGFSVGYGVELRRPIDPVPHDPFQRGPRGPTPLMLAPLSLGFRVSDVRGFEDSISAARGTGFDVGATIYHPSLGSELSVVEATAHLTHYLPVPWWAHHVLALRVAAGISAGDTGSRSTFALGGLDVRNVVADAVEDRSAPTDVLRGYPPAARRGPAFWLATAEYRLPIFDLAGGVDTVPAFADRLHAAVYVDFGDTPREGLRFEDAAAGVGAELRLDLVFGYFVPIRLRAGYARGLTDDGIHDVYLVVGGGY